MFQFESIIRYSETDLKGHLTMPAMMDYFQDCSVLHSESLHSGIDFFEDSKFIWMLSTWQVCVERMPKLAEKIRIRTWAYGMKGFYGYRNFSMDTLDGERLAYADSTWIFMDRETGHPVRIPEEYGGLYQMEEPIEMERFGRKIPIPDSYEEWEPIVVPNYFIDTNQHMNNGKYILVAKEYLSAEAVVREIWVEYKKSAKLGDILVPRVTTEDGAVTVVLAEVSGNPYCIVKFLLEKM